MDCSKSVVELRKLPLEKLVKVSIGLMKKNQDSLEKIEATANLLAELLGVPQDLILEKYESKADKKRAAQAIERVAKELR